MIRFRFLLETRDARLRGMRRLLTHCHIQTSRGRRAGERLLLDRSAGERPLLDKQWMGMQRRGHSWTGMQERGHFWMGVRKYSNNGGLTIRFLLTKYMQNKTKPQHCRPNTYKANTPSFNVVKTLNKCNTALEQTSAANCEPGLCAQ